MLKLLKISGLLIGIISFSSCGKLPLKPDIDSGIIITEINEVYYVNNQTGEEKSEPIILEGCILNPKLNKHQVHSNADWNEVLLYIRLLEDSVPKDIKHQLRKIRNSSKILNKKVEAYGL